MALQANLEALVLNKLTIWQGATAAGTDPIAYAALEALDVNANPFAGGGAFEHMNARLKDWTDEISAELNANRTFPWIVPSAAAVLFEGFFDTCVAYWIARGQPNTPANLRPDVQRFVKAQVRLFTRLIGAK